MGPTYNPQQQNNTSLQPTYNSQPMTFNPQQTVNGLYLQNTSTAGNVLGPTDTYSAPPAPVYVDPYAKYGGIDNYNKTNAGFNATEANIYTSADRNATTGVAKYKRGIQDWLLGASSKQKGIDKQSANNELALMNGAEGIRGMVGRGINSAGVMLGNRNAGDSSATGAIANAYGQLGQRQMAGIGNQYSQNAQDIGLEQSNLNEAAALQQTRNEEDKAAFITTVINDATDQIKDLNLQKSQADVGTQIAIDQEIAKIKSATTAKLSAVDPIWTSGVAGLKGATRPASMTTAQGLRSAGTDLGNNSFNFTEQAPLTFQGNAPAGGNMPLYTMPRGSRQE